MNVCIKTKYLRPNFIVNLYRFFTTSPEVEVNEQVLIDDADDTRAKEAQIEKKRNISRLSAAHYNLVNGRVPYDTPKLKAHLTVKYNRKIYGQYGLSSGVNPIICWPTKSEIQEREEYESVAFPFTIKQMMDTAAQKRREQQLKVEEREEELATKFQKLELWKKELNDRINKKVAEAQKAKEKKERLVEEVRRHFGFTLDPRDERFQEMLTKREKEQKKLEKKAKIEAKEKTMIAKLQQKNVEINEKAS